MMKATNTAAYYSSSYQFHRETDQPIQTTIFDTFEQETYNQQGEDIMKSQYEILNNQSNRLNCPIILNPQIASFDDVALHALLRQRLKVGTVEKRIRYARFMENHPIPVDFRNPNYTNFIRHMDYREQVENAGNGALSNAWKTMRMFLKAYGMELWSYKAPSQPSYRARIIPFPDQVYKMLNLTYSKDQYENALIQYLLTHNFIVGWRFPSEPAMMKTTNVNIEREYITITEPKKHHSTRNISPVEIMTNTRRKSFKNWIDHWRPKVENQYSQDYLYLKPDGKPFSTDLLRQLLNRKATPDIQAVFPEYYNYCSRHFSAVSRLIRTKIEHKTFDEYEVRDWLGHTKIETTMGYIKDAKHYYLLAPYDWINRVLKAPNQQG
ncbi:MAG: site-specific integrase [Euryarchaeota archaeon]|nr:site-specific integrase [Euryarchaeota archaeon]